MKLGTVTKWDHAGGLRLEVLCDDGEVINITRWYAKTARPGDRVELIPRVGSGWYIKRVVKEVH